MADALSIEDGTQLQEWLRDKPRKWADDLEVRAALRVLPLVLDIFRASGDEVEPDTQKSIAIGAFRSAVTIWAAQALPGSVPAHASLAAGQSAVMAITKPILPSGGSYVTASAAMTAISNAAIRLAQPSLSEKVHGSAAAAEAAGLVSMYEGQHDMWESIRADANWLISNSSEALITQPLWLVDVRRDNSFKVNFPPWARRPFDVFKSNMLVVDGLWGVWLVWYQSVLDGPSRVQFNRQMAQAISAQSEKFWDRSPDQVTADIASLAGWHRPPPPPPPPPEPEQELDGLRQLLLNLILARAEQLRTRRQSVEPQSDEPTADDQLGRRPFAQALVERMDRIYQKGGHDGFAAHIYAPWGAGKTSVLMMMRDLMTAKDRKSTDGQPAPHWVVVRFNAWEQERRNPPWWPLVEAVKGECLTRLSGARGGWSFALSFFKEWWLKGYQVKLQPLLLELRWVRWKLKTDALPYIVLLAVFAGAFSLLWAGGATSTPYDFPLKVFAAAVAAYASFLGASRIAVFGSSSNAKFYDDISQDPLMRITRLFRKIVEKTNAPVCIFIDDLDRCRSEYVVDLLEGIQTSFRHRSVAYVVAADRAWIKASFESRYGSFSSAVSNLGQPLGYLFLEKVFQVSTPVPGMGDSMRSAYWNRLLRPTSIGRDESPIVGSPSVGPAGNLTSQQFDRAVEVRRAELREQHGDDLTREVAEVILEKSDSAEDRAAIVLELNASRAAEKEAEHQLAQFVGVLPDNPRVMKRMLNAFAMRQAIGLLERSGTPSAVLARWTILEQRFPSLADLLIDHPEWTRFLSGNTEHGDAIPPALQPFVDSDVVPSIVGSRSDQGLTPEQVIAITRGSKT